MSRLIVVLTGLLLATCIAASSAAAQGPTDSGFRPATDGFAFENYGAGQPNLGAAEMRRLFGDVVCGSKPASDACALTPPANAWMANANKSMDGGHCMGFSIAALRFFAQASAPAAFGAPTTFGLTLTPAIAREIAYGFAYQMLDRVQQAKIDGTPKQILARLQALLANRAETYTIAIFKPGFKDGHAITPYAVEDRGNGTFAIKVYDNNFPKEERDVIVDTKADTFSYNTATNPQAEVDLYKGDATTGTLFLYPTTPGQGVQPCPFCEEAKAATESVEVAPAGAIRTHASVRISDGTHTVGDKDGTLVNTFGDQADVVHLLDDLPRTGRREPFFKVPGGRGYAITVTNRTGKRLTGEGVRVTGPGFATSVRGLHLAPHQSVAIRISADGRTLRFASARRLTQATIAIGRTEPGADHAFVLQRTTPLGARQPLIVRMDPGADRLRVDGQPGTYDLVAERIDDAGEQVFRHDAIAGDDDFTFAYADWDGTQGSTIGLDGDGATEQDLGSAIAPDADPDHVEDQVTDER